LEELEDQNIIENAAVMGALLKRRLEGLMAHFPFIGDVRGKGLLLAFELVADRGTMQPLAKELNAYTRLVEIAYDLGLIIYSRRTRGGLEGDHFLICPPLIITEPQIDELMELLEASLTRLADEIMPAASEFV
jgi:4-aminobutyrate aminotransferase-like enzyme